MDYNHITRASTPGLAFGSTLANEYLAMIFNMRWVIALALILIIVDYRFGVRKSELQGESFRWSTAQRRSLSKLLDYFCWILVASTMALAMGEWCSVTFGCTEHVAKMVICIGIMFFCMRPDAESIWTNYRMCKGMPQMSFSKFVTRLFINFLKAFNPKVGDAVEDTVEDMEKEEKEQENNETPKGHFGGGRR